MVLGTGRATLLHPQPLDSTMPFKLGSKMSRCAKCGEKFRVSLAEHYKQAHQPGCNVLFKGEDRKIQCERGSDGTWQCPRCGVKFHGSPRKLQDHARKGGCEQHRVTNESDEEHLNSASDVDSDLRSTSSANLTEMDEPAHDRDADPDLDNQAIEAKLEVVDVPEISLHEDDQPCAPPADLVSTPSQNPVSELGQRPNAASTAQTASGNNDSPFLWVKLHAPITKRRLTPLEALQAASQPRSKRPTLVKPERSEASVHEVAPLALSAPAIHTPTSFPAPSRPSVVTSTSAGPSRDQSATVVAFEHAAASLFVPPALKAFFDTTRVPLDHLAPIFVENGFDDDATLDLLCELPPEGHWEEMKNEIIKQGRLAGWLAVQKGLRQRAKTLVTQRPS